MGRPPSGGKRKVPTSISTRTPLLSRWLWRISVTFIAPNWAESRPRVPSQGYSPTSGHLKVQSNLFFASRLVVRLGSVVWRSLPIPHPPFRGAGPLARKPGSSGGSFRFLGAQGGNWLRVASPRNLRFRLPPNASHRSRTRIFGFVAAQNKRSKGSRDDPEVIADVRRVCDVRGGRLA